jgi:flagellar hook protein FlgE
MGSGLLDIMRRSRNSLSAFEASLRIKTNNSANVATTGYKSITQSFTTVFNEVLNGGIGSQTGQGSVNPTQFGSDVAISNIKLDFSQGDLGEGTQMDMAVTGRGLFMVSRDGGNSFLYTRAGEFGIDTTGQFVVDSSGRQLFGYKVNGGVADTSELVPIDVTGMNNLGWRANGVLVSNFVDASATTPVPSTGPETAVYQVAMADFRNPEGLLQFDGTAFEATLSSGIPTATGVAGTGDLGTIQPQKVEKSNVFFIGETIDAIEIQRAISASLSSIKMASDIISQVINRLSS